MKSRVTTPEVWNTAMIMPVLKTKICPQKVYDLSTTRNLWEFVMKECMTAIEKQGYATRYSKVFCDWVYNEDEDEDEMTMLIKFQYSGKRKHQLDFSMRETDVVLNDYKYVLAFVEME
jgi:hypothetical protein